MREPTSKFCTSSGGIGSITALWFSPVALLAAVQLWMV
jgi:hypothetical protein